MAGALLFRFRSSGLILLTIFLRLPLRAGLFEQPEDQDQENDQAPEPNRAQLARPWARHARRSKESFYNYAIKMVLKHSKGTIKEAKLRFDSHGERSVRRALTNYLRRELNTPEFRTFTDLKFKDSAQDDLIQLADMVAGAIRKSFERSRPEDAHYREIIKGREDDVWSFC